mmetsp:Transcript_70284/g.156552  ORF Transcript_70284/g.156552 Transcript_70284/m.156552 type:complete len:84 (-) Transcript_70284:300-551(-)
MDFPTVESFLELPRAHAPPTLSDSLVRGWSRKLNASQRSHTAQKPLSQPHLSVMPKAATCTPTTKFCAMNGGSCLKMPPWCRF